MDRPRRKATTGPSQILSASTTSKTSTRGSESLLVAECLVVLLVVEEVDDPLLGRRAPVPQETCVLVAADSSDEAHYLCGLVNSASIRAVNSAHL